MNNESISAAERLPENIKTLMRENAYNLVAELMMEQVPFRIVLWNMDNWDYDLPEDIMESFPVQIALDIAGQTMEESYIDEGVIYINTYFHNKPYSKVLVPREIIAVLDEEGQPFIINNFEPVNVLDAMNEILTPASEEDVLELITMVGVPKENAKKSLEAFKKNKKI